MPGDLSDLVCRVGGTKPAARLLGVTAETLTDWERTGRAPSMALRLLWFCGPDGEAALEEHFHRQLVLLAHERDALREELTRARATIDERRGALGARVIALQVENSQLRQICQQGFPMVELKAACARLLGLLGTLEPEEAKAIAGEGSGAGQMITSVQRKASHEHLGPV
jgi:hypothetical protein